MPAYRETDDPTPPPCAERPRREPAAVPEGERLERLLAGLVVTRPSDDAVCQSLLRRNLVVTVRAA